MIPKTIHFCWFSGAAYPLVVRHAMSSWDKHLGDYEIKKWDLSNIGGDLPEFVEEAILHRKWAFVSDYVRVKVLYEYGGIYLDADMVVVCPFPQRLLEHASFFGCQTSSLVDCAIIGSEKGHGFIGQIMRYYHSATFDVNRPKPMPNVVSPMLREMGFSSCTRVTQIDKKVVLYPPAYFYPYPFPPPPNSDYKDYIQPETLAVHLWAGSWLGYREYFNMGECKKGVEALRKAGKNDLLNRWCWVAYCKAKKQLKKWIRK